MTDTTSAAPSDAEIDALGDQFRWDTTQGRRDYARAVLARWGAPQPVARWPLSVAKIAARLMHENPAWPPARVMDRAKIEYMKGRLE